MKISKICCRNFNIDHPGHLTRYNYFLYCCGSCYAPKSSKQCGVDCKEHINIFRDHFVTTILHNNFNKLKNELDYWMTTLINLSIHPITGMIIKKQFIRFEKIKLTKVTRNIIYKALK